ncbi:WecB/TagA/CpsF family glycosyltransferase [Sphingobium sp. PNB]|uniref:WecB/TagA/CpsF family glycosyltransferase n=1 Tax=Sphingobium sp. PNB TaxID=863934 RepID=UPI001D01FF88|nr:WecB/TagA/CpsF family glycosyltransferase [Sphingobium sp. PNB]MCB4858168.1 WecB/TagA/CpsF family glycosyltransferase [Sphingobium sp. PNB]
MATLLSATDMPLLPATGSRTAASGKISFLDFDFCDLSVADALAAILERPAGSPFAYVVTPNVDHVVRIQRRRSDLWPAYRSAWLCLCDSRILSRLAANAGVKLPAAPGSDLTAALMADALSPGDRIAIVGGSTSLIASLREKLPAVDFLHLNPPMGFAANPSAFAEARDFLVQARARFAIIAVGSPQQEMLAWHVARTGKAVGTALCVGASLEFLTGEQVRAPGWMQAMSLEWLFRFLSNPRRLWRRYMIEGPVILPIYRKWLSRRLANGSDGPG